MSHPSDRMVSPQLSANGAPCPLCGGEYEYGQHMIRARAGERCVVPGCTAKLFEKCHVNGRDVAWRCLGPSHRVLLLEG